MSHTEDLTQKNAQQPAGGLENSEAVLAARLAAPCDIRMRQHGARYTLFLGEFGLTASGEDLPALVAELKAEREKRLRQLAAEGVLSWLPGPAERCTGAAPGVLVQLKPFLIKAAVFALLFLGSLAVIGFGLGAAGKQLETQVSGVANWPQEKVERESARTRAFVSKLRPVVRELQLLFNDAPEQGAAKTANATAPGAGS